MTTFFFAILLAISFLSRVVIGDRNQRASSSGREAFETGIELESNQEYKEAAEYFWKSVLKGYNVEQSFKMYLTMYSKLGMLEVGYLNIARQYYNQKNSINGKHFVESSIEILPTFDAYCLLVENSHENSDKEKYLELAGTVIDLESVSENLHLGNEYFGIKKYSQSLHYFDAVIKLDPSHDYAVASAAYLRSNIADWGPNGSTFETNMADLAVIIAKEAETMQRLLDSGFQREVKASAVHPHMSLSYPIDPMLKLAVARSHALTEVNLVNKHNLTVYTHDPALYRAQASSSGFRLRVGYSSANFKSKATMYMAKDVLRNHLPANVELHIFATTGPDNERFLREAMRGVDWRQELQESAEHFHDVSGLDVAQQAAFIRKLGIHILVDWDGYSNNGVRAAGLFAQQPAPLQVLHQEYVGTMGAPYIQYLVTDQRASPQSLERQYSERFMYMPHSFLANSFAHQAPHLSPPERELDEEDLPQTNGCGGLPASFVYCSFNKHLKMEPALFRLWLSVLTAVPGSILCLLEYPKESKANIWHFVDEYAAEIGSSVNATINGSELSLRRRVRFLPFVMNPYDNQRRVAHSCNVVLDTVTYQGHTTSFDGLWGGVPLVTLGTGKDLAARVGISTLTVLNLTELIAMDRSSYAALAVRLAAEDEYYQHVRNQIINSCLQQFPHAHPLWDMRRYARNLEQGFHLIWNNFIAGLPPKHVFIEDVGPSANWRWNESVLKSRNGTKTNKRKDKQKSAVKILPERTDADSSSKLEEEPVLQEAHVVASVKKKCGKCKCKRRKSPTPNGSEACKLPVCSALEL